MAGESLRVTVGNAAGTQIPIGQELQIGRSATGAGTLGDDPEISRNHAKVSYSAQGVLVVEDVGSTNGTFVNGQRITAPTPLKAGDTLQMGKSTMQVLDPSGRAPQATAFGAAPPAPPPPPPPVAVPAPAGFGAGPQSPPTQPLPGGVPVAGGPVRPVGAPAGGGGGKTALIIILLLAMVGGAVAAFLLLSGGGDDKENRAAVEKTLRSYLEDNDCDTLTDEYISEIFNQSGQNARQACETLVANATGLDDNDYEIKSIVLENDGDAATAEIEGDNGDEATYKFVKEDDEYKINSIRGELNASGAMASTTTTTETPTEEATEEEETSTEEMTDPRQIEAIATLQALIKAVRRSDERVFCGLLSPRQAQKLVGGPGGDAAIARCVTILKGRDFSGNLPRTLKVSGVKVTGNQASVRLTNGERFTLVRRGGRYVVNSGVAN